MTQYLTRLFQTHLNGDPEPRMVFAKTLDDACRYALKYEDRGQRLRQIIVWDATDNWLELSGDVRHQTKQILEAGYEGVAIYWQDRYDEGWRFVGPDEENA